MQRWRGARKPKIRAIAMLPLLAFCLSTRIAVAQSTTPYSDGPGCHLQSRWSGW